MRTNNDCNCTTPHVDCWSSRCRHDALKAVKQQRDELLDALNYLMSRFDDEYYHCSHCGNEETTSDCDSAIWLRDFLEAIAKARGQA